MKISVCCQVFCPLRKWCMAFSFPNDVNCSSPSSLMTCGAAGPSKRADFFWSKKLRNVLWGMKNPFSDFIVFEIWSFKILRIYWEKKKPPKIFEMFRNLNLNLTILKFSVLRHGWFCTQHSKCIGELDEFRKKIMLGVQPPSAIRILRGFVSHTPHRRFRPRAPVAFRLNHLSNWLSGITG